jgi:putative ABC transport system ATP-binding protein
MDNMPSETHSKVPVIEAQGLWKIYNEGTPAQVNALSDINLKVMEGEFVAIQGASGSGKSTLLNLMGCLDNPSRGKLFIDGKDVAKMGQDALAKVRREKIGFIFQSFNIIPSLTAIQNVELPMAFSGIGVEQRAQKAKSLLSGVDMGHRIDHKPNQLSGGEVQRVAIARALGNDPVLILADEPTGNLDSKRAAEIMEILCSLHSQGKTIVMITHEANLARCAERRIFLKDGMIEKEEKLR